MNKGRYLLLSCATVLSIIIVQVYTGLILGVTSEGGHKPQQFTRDVNVEHKIQGAEARLKSEGAKKKKKKEPLDNAESRCLSQPWLQRHAEIQRAIIAGERPPRYLVLQPFCGYCGMCNKLNGILGSYLTAVLLDRAFIIDWSYNDRGSQPNSKYLEPRMINWTAEAAVDQKSFAWPPEKTKLLSGWHYNDKLQDILAETNFTMLEPYESLIFNELGEAPTQALMLNPHAKARAVERGIMSEDTVWDSDWNERFKACAVRTLFKPSDLLKEAYCGLLGDTAHRGMAIHIRTGDDRWTNVEVMDPTGEQYRFAQCADGMRKAITYDYMDRLTMERHPINVDKWHVASDWQPVIEDMKRVFPDNIVYIDSFQNISNDHIKGNKVREHSANTHHEQFSLGPLLELVYLSTAVAVIGTCRSTFSASAGYFGLLPKELVLLKRTNFENRYFHTTNCPEMPENAESMCRDLVQNNRALIDDVLRTPPFITCPNMQGKEKKQNTELENTAKASRSGDPDLLCDHRSIHFNSFWTLEHHWKLKESLAFIE